MRVYKNFDDLIKHNKSLFKRILEDGHIDLMRACWSARDAEVKGIEKRLIYKEQDLKRNEDELLLLKEDYSSLVSKHELAVKDIDRLTTESKTQKQELVKLGENCESLEKFNKELLEAQNNLQEDIKNYEHLNELKEAEYVSLKDEFDREKLEAKIELKNAQEAIAYSNELEDLQRNNLKYIEELEIKISTVSKEYEMARGSFQKQTERVSKLEKELISNQKNSEILNRQKKELENKQNKLLRQVRSLEQSSIKLNENLSIAKSSGRQKQTNLTQLQSTLELKIKTLDERDKEVQLLTNKLKNHEQLMQELKDEINLMEKVLCESEQNQHSLEEYAEKLKITTERELIKRKEADAKYELMRAKMAQILTEKENLEAKFKSVERTLSGIHQQLAPKKSAMKPAHHVQLDN